MTGSFLQAVRDHYDDDPLAFARRLIDQGVPVFVAPPGPGSVGFRLPSGWQGTKASARALDAWQPGWAVCAVGGHTLDVVDVDPRNGGDKAAEALRSAGAWPREYAVVSTPSGGTHHYVARLGIAKAAREGIDLQAGAPDGTGRGFVFLPGTTRTSKVDGVERPYVLVADHLDTFGADDDTGAALRSWVTAKAPAPSNGTDPWAQFASIGGVPELGTPITLADQHDNTLTAYAASVVSRAPGLTFEEVVAAVVRRGQDCVPSWASGMKQGHKTLEAAAREDWVPSALRKFGQSFEGPLDPESAPLTEHETAVAREAERLRIAGDAKRLVANERAATEFRDPPSWASLTEALAEPDEPVRYLVDKLLPAGGNAVLTAPFKAGKTTLVNNLARALADGTPFLGRFDVEKPAGRIALWNYEVSAGQYRRWLRDAGIENTDAVAAVNLRGHRLDLTTTHGEEWAVRWLGENGVSVWIVDPYGRALAGADENSNSEVGRFLEAIDVIKDRAGVGELVMPAHTGRQNFEAGEERARGAARIDDWPDARWLLTRDEKLDARFFRATGRDVDVEEEQLTFDPATRRLAFGGWDRGTLTYRAALDRGVPLVLEAVRVEPGIGSRELREALKPMRSADVDAAVREALKLGQIEIRRDGRKNGHHPIGGAIAA